jgi:hypothetical protein
MFNIIEFIVLEIDFSCACINCCYISSANITSVNEEEVKYISL